MALPINIADLLNKQKVESNRIEFKEGWNPISIYHSICAFANDIDNLGGGYIVVGVAEKNGIAQRPVKGLPIESLDDIQKAMVGFNHLIEPYYAPKISIEEIDGKQIFVIWIPSGTERPYTVPEDITSKKQKKPAFYIRYGSNSIIAKGEQLDELREISAKVPYDDRGNDKITEEDISLIQIRDYLSKVDSKLAQEAITMPMTSILEHMDLMTGPSEKRLIKNVAAMMFCEHPEKIFPYTQVEIVIFPEGREENPDNMIEAPVIRGTVPHMISETLSYLRTNIVKEQIIKPKNQEESTKFFNYPYQALEESVTNALYHRDYRLYEPVEITIEPNRISILSHSGPDRSITEEALQKAKSLRSRRYRNRRLGDFLKELDLTEGRATGIPTIQKSLKENGSPAATIETDSNRTYFLIDIPCHQGFGVTVAFNKQEGVTTMNDLSQALSQALSQVQSCRELLDFQNVEPNLYQALYQALYQVLSQNWDKPTLTSIIQILKETIEDCSMKQLLKTVREKNRMRLMNLYIKPLMVVGLIEMIHPEVPKHPKQKYKLSDKGRVFLLKIFKRI